MAGYFTKLNGRVYDGGHIAAAPLENGTFVVINANDKVVASAANTNIEFACVEKTDLWGEPALRLRCEKEDGTVFMVENDPLIYVAEEYDEAHRTCKAGEYVKMRTPNVGDEIFLGVTDAIYEAATVGAKYNVAANGAIAKKA